MTDLFSRMNAAPAQPPAAQDKDQGESPRSDGQRACAICGAPLLGQVWALSTVSGGSWLGVPFTYLPSSVASDDAYLGPYVADQSKLTPAELAVLPDGNAGAPITSDTFSVTMLALEALILYEVLGVAPNML